MLKRILEDDSGATAIEYSMIAMLISIVCIAIWQSLGLNFADVINTARIGMGGEP